LKVAAKVDPEDQDYYEQEIKHRFDDPLVEFLGEADEEAKRRLLAGAYALLFPNDWPEPLGKGMIEALAGGAPLPGLDCGAVREVVRHGVTGLIGDSVDDLVALAPRIGELDRRVCRREAERRFSAQAMAEGYEQIYTRLIAEQR